MGSRFRHPPPSTRSGRGRVSEYGPHWPHCVPAAGIGYRARQTRWCSRAHAVLLGTHCKSSAMRRAHRLRNPLARCPTLDLRLALALTDDSFRSLVGIVRWSDVGFDDARVGDLSPAGCISRRRVCIPKYRGCFSASPRSWHLGSPRMVRSRSSRWRYHHVFLAVGNATSRRCWR